MPPKNPSVPVKSVKAGAGVAKKSAKARKGEKIKEFADIPLLPLQESVMSIGEKDMDLIWDLNENFFTRANKVIQILMQSGRTFEASKIKLYVDIIFKLHRKYVDEVKENEKLKPEVAKADTKLKIALELTGNSEEAMKHLKQALADAWHKSDVTLAREQEVQEQLQDILIKCEKLEGKKDAKQDDGAEFGHLSKYKNIILRERDRLNGEVIDLEKRLEMQRYYSESLEYIIHNHEDSLTKLGTRVKVLDAEKLSMNTKIKTLMSNLEDQRDMNNKTVNKLDATLKELNETNSKLVNKIAEYDRLKILTEKQRSDNLLQLKQLTKYEGDIGNLQKEQKELEELIKSMRLEDKVKGNTITQLNNNYKKVVQDHSVVSSKLYKINRINNNLNDDIVRLKNQANSLEKDLLNSAHKLEDVRRLKDTMQRERDTLRSDIIKLNNQIADLRHTIIIQNNNIDNLHLDINKLNVRLDEAKINISKAEKERDEMAQEVDSLHERIEYFQDQIQLKTDQVANLTENIQQKQRQLITMKKQLETVYSEKMILQRSLETCTQERDNFRLLQTKTTHQITQLTNEILANQNKISTLNLQIERLNNDKKELQSELKNKENVLANVRKDLKETKSKNENLLKAISEDELKFIKIAQDLDETRKEKNLIGLQMVRRNDEIVLLKEKLNIAQTALDQGQTQYNLRIEDIRLLKVEITNLQTERQCLSRAIKSTANMREEIIRLQRLLNQERVRVRSLTEDAKTPTGVHRWRILKGYDPNKFQLLAKMQMLQRRSLKQEIEKANIQRKLEESQKVNETLKSVVENLPSTKVKQKLMETQRINKRQLKQLKALRAELKIDEIELKARECVIEKFKATLKLTKHQMCGAGDVAVASSLQRDVTDYTSQENYTDCVFSFSDDTQRVDENQLESVSGKDMFLIERNSL